ncbi:CHAT domain-containing protein [Promicromonospora sp. NFX87]|uniref:CHAT domain-containing protein n=1 Tax=Promicromonospora sp. NFX87 TaxID=3402691 RepID=UPI003AFA9B9B
MDVRVALQSLPRVLPRVVLDVVADHPKLRKTRSTRDRIGSYHADLDWILGAEQVLRPLTVRLLLLVAATLGGMLVGFPWWAAALLGLGCSLALAGLAANIAGVAIGVTILALFPATWSWVVIAGYGAVMVLASERLLTVIGGGALGPGLGFMPVRVMTWFLVRGVWSNFAVGVDKALGDDVHRAEPFLSYVEDRVGPYRTVVVHARALVLARTGEASAGLRMIATDTVDPSLPRSVRGWCRFVVSDILAYAGQDEAAVAQLRRAIPLLQNRRSRGVRIAAQLRLIDSAIKQGELDKAIDTLRDLRWFAVSNRHSDLVTTTEGYLVQMMLAAGNEPGALWTLATVSLPDSRKGRANESRSRTAMWSVLHAQVAMQQGEEGEARRQSDNAVQRADDLPDFSVRAAAHLVRAEHLYLFTGAQDALPHVLESLGYLQHVRYGLPGSHWRRGWVRLNSRAYELALEVASDLDDPHLVAEMLENIRAQAIPVGLDHSDRSLSELLEAIMDPFAKRPGELRHDDAGGTSQATGDVLAAAGADPLMPPPAVGIQGASWVRGPAERTLDLDALIVTTVGDLGWYWSACIGGGRYWWTVRQPGGTWYWGSTDLAEGSLGRGAFDDLIQAIPVRFTGESNEVYGPRVRSSALAGSATGHELVNRLADAFLPPPIRDDLAKRDPDNPMSLLVSLAGSLAALPVNALHVSDGHRVIDTAVVGHVPTSVMLDRLHAERSLSRGTKSAITLSVVDPDPTWHAMEHAKAPASSTTVLGRPTTKADVIAALQHADPEGVFCAFAHYARRSEPAAGGLAVAGGVLSLRDLVGSEEAIRVPERALLSLCESLAAGASETITGNEAADLYAGTWEWLGLTAGFILAGARHVVATAWPVIEDEHEQTRLIDHALANALAQPHPAFAVRAAILKLAPPGATGNGLAPILWSAYTYTGLFTNAEPETVTVPE